MPAGRPFIRQGAGGGPSSSPSVSTGGGGLSQADLDALEAEIAAGDAATLTSANGYTDLSQGAQGLDIQQVADSVGDEAVIRAAADSTLQAEIAAVTGGVDQVGFVAHAAVATVARPAGHDIVIWYGTVEPTNAEAPDIWLQEGSGGGGGGGGADLQAHVAATTNVHGITNASQLVYTNDARLAPTIEKVTLTSARTLATTDAGKVLEFNTGATASTLIIPAGLSTAYPIDGITEFFQMGSGPVDVDGSAVTLRAPDSAAGLDGQYRTGYLRRRDTNDWVLSGAVS